MRDDIDYLDIEDLYVTLLEDILKHRYRYYVLSDPVIDDLEYDRRERVLYKIEEQYPDLTSKYSPSKAVGSENPKHYPEFTRKEFEQ